jgi:hypothetical protein
MCSFDLFGTGYRSSPLGGDYLLHRGARANKPKALSTPTTAELGTNARSEGRAVLVSAKTIPCPNKSGPLTVTLAAPVRLNRSLLRHNRDALALSDPKWQKGVQKCRAGAAPAPRQGRRNDKRRPRHFRGQSDASMAHSVAQLFEGENR